MKHVALVITTAILVAAATAVVFRRFPIEQGHAAVVHSQGPTVERLEQLSHLVSMRVYVADVLTAESESYRGAWLIRGDALIGVNLGRVRIADKDEQARRATLCLPQPEVLQCRVDHERTRTWEVRRTTWVPWRGDEDKLRDSVMLEAQKLVAHAASSSENLSQAKANAETVLRGFYQEVGWQVNVSWQRPEAEAKDGSFVLPGRLTGIVKF
jgi:hypothetical protein